MLESILAMGGTSTHDLLNKTVNLQPHNNNDYMRFQTELKNSDDIKTDTSVLEVKNADNPINIGEADNSNPAYNAFMDMDSSYHKVIKGMHEMPVFQEFLQERTFGGDAIRTNADAISADMSPAEKTAKLLDEQQHVQDMAIEYKAEMSRWHISTEMFMTKVKILTSVVSQASQGLKTLFRSSG